MNYRGISIFLCPGFAACNFLFWLGIGDMSVTMRFSAAIQLGNISMAAPYSHISPYRTVHKSGPLIAIRLRTLYFSLHQPYSS